MHLAGGVLRGDISTQYHCIDIFYRSLAEAFWSCFGTDNCPSLCNIRDMFLLEESFYILQLAFKGKQVINIFNVRRPPDKKGFLYGLQNELHVFFNITTFSSS